ncbi:hypothetical protein PENTCL1PPCAC_21403, partial [Pristionchus entomophagus]
EYGTIYEAMMKKNVIAYESGNVAGALEMYDEHGVVVDKKEIKSFFGADQIKQMIEGFIKMGKVEFQSLNKNIHDVGGDRFYVTADFESKFVDSGVAMKGSFEQLFHKKGDQYKCVYECFSMQ